MCGLNCGQQIDSDQNNCRSCEKINQNQSSKDENTTVPEEISSSDISGKKGGFSPDTNASFWTKKKTLFIVAISAVVVISIFFLALKISAHPLEHGAKKCLRVLENKIGEVELIDVVCFSVQHRGDDSVSYKYFFLFEQSGDPDFALFYDDFTYMGNGYNGAFAESSEDRNFKNVVALSYFEDYLECVLGELGSETDITYITYEEAEKENKEGIIRLDIEKIQ